MLVDGLHGSTVTGCGAVYLAALYDDGHPCGPAALSGGYGDAEVNATRRELYEKYRPFKFTVPRAGQYVDPHPIDHLQRDLLVHQ